MKQVLSWRPPLWLVVLLLSLTLVLGTGAGYVRGSAQYAECPESTEVCEQFSNFWRVWNIAEERFVDPSAIEPDQMVVGAINGMLDTLDDQGHTRYTTAEQYQRERESQRGEYEGIGAYINEEGGLPFIVAPIEGSPAEAAGVQAGDFITKVNGESTQGMTVDEVVRRVRGEPGTSVTLELRRAGQEAPIEVTITRAAINVPAVTWTMLPDNVAHIKLSQFSEKAAPEMEEALAAAKAAGAEKLVLDLRNNPGGLLDQAIAVTSMFLPPDQPVLRVRDRDNNEEVYKSNQPNPETELPMIVLINTGSASSSEIFAGALQDYDRATIVGLQTLGLGTVVTPIRLPDGSAVYLGTAEWLTPKERPLRNKGVTPDITVELPTGASVITPSEARDMTEEEILQSDDTQLLRALEELSSTVSTSDQR
jgi:carboxyl-terminal processing protease